MCINALGPTESFCLSTASGYASVMTTCPVRAQGNKAVWGVLVIAISSSATLAGQIQVSYDDRKTWVNFGSAQNATAIGPFQVSGTSLDAAWIRLMLTLTGTTVVCAGSTTLNGSSL